MHCQVETYSGFRLHERPRRFTWGEVWLEVRQVMAQWMVPGGLCYKVKAGEGVYVLRYDQAQDAWDAELLKPG